MKKVLKSYSILLAICTFSITSCSEEFLEKAPVSSLVSGTIKTSEDAENLLTGAYNRLVSNSFYQYDHFLMTDGLSDNCYINGDNVTAEQPLENFTFSSSTSTIQSGWQYLYEHIKASNAVLEEVPKIDDPKWAGSNRKNEILAEASFLRAMDYYWLVSEFGKAPIILTVLNGGNYYPARNSESEIYEQIIKDLVFAEGILPDKPYQSQYGRATKGSAQALLAKVYAQMGDYQNCKVYANKVINGGTYSLVANYANLWGAANKNTSESIFEIQVPSSGSPYNFFGMQLFCYVPSDAWPKRNIGSYDLIKAFNDAGDNGARYTSTFNWQVANASFNMPINAWDAEKAVPFMYKLPDPNSWAGIDNIIVIRLADIILLGAEADNQLGDIGSAVTLLNKVRTRAGLSNTTANSKNTLALAILAERRLELVHEGTRWNDLLRADANGTINLVTLMNSQVDSHGKNLNYNMNPDKHQFIFPIPLQDLQLNKNLTQNPGY